MDPQHHHQQHIDSSHPSWLVFSLSNNSHQLSLYHQTPSFPSDPSSIGGAVDQENGGPKLEDFLGGAGGGSSAVSQAAAAPRFDGGSDTHQGVNMPGHVEMYDSELKNIAASFLRGFSNEGQHDAAQRQLAAAAPPQEITAAKKAVESFGQRTSIFRGVTRHRWTGRYEAHLWDNSCRREGQSRKGRQVYLGGYDKEEKAARAYDLAALKYWGPTTTTNFPVSDYEREIEEMKHMTRQEFVASLRRKSSGFSRGASIYRGVTRHHQHGRWQARIGRVAGNKDLYLGTFSTQEEAAEAYDIAAIKFRGLNAVTNFDMSRYDVRSIATSNLPIGNSGNNKPKASPESSSADQDKTIEVFQPPPPGDSNHNKETLSATSAIPVTFGVPLKQDQSSNLWAALGYQLTPITTNAKNPTSSTNDTLFHDSDTVNGTTLQLHGTTPFSMEFSEAHSSNGDGYFTGYGYYHHQHEQQNDEQRCNGATTSTSTSTSSSTSTGCIVPNSNTTHDAAVNGGAGTSWSPEPVHSFQAGNIKTSVSSFQTPIFGME